jgi:hypothetical protein
MFNLRQRPSSVYFSTLHHLNKNGKNMESRIKLRNAVKALMTKEMVFNSSEDDWGAAALTNARTN